MNSFSNPEINTRYIIATPEIADYGSQYDPELAQKIAACIPTLQFLKRGGLGGIDTGDAYVIPSWEENGASDRTGVWSIRDTANQIASARLQLTTTYPSRDQAVSVLMVTPEYTYWPVSEVMSAVGDILTKAQAIAEVETIVRGPEDIFAGKKLVDARGNGKIRTMFGKLFGHNHAA